jgi:hypothetical protein
MPLNINDARAAVNQRVRQLNRTIIQRAPASLVELANKHSFYIYNVGWKMWQKGLGGLGTFTVQACKKGEKYSPPLVIPLLYPETIKIEMNKAMEQQLEGLEIVYNIIEFGPFQPGEGTEGQGLLKWGVFMTENEIPSETDLAEANRLLDKQCIALVDQADRFNMQPPEPGKPSNITDDHHMAVARLGLARDWSRGPQKMISCPGCGEPVKPGIVRHGGTCGYIFDRDQYMERFASPTELVAYAAIKKTEEPQKNLIPNNAPQKGNR